MVCVHVWFRRYGVYMGVSRRYRVSVHVCVC